MTQRTVSYTVIHSSVVGSDPDAKLVRWRVREKRVDPPHLILQMKLRHRLLLTGLQGTGWIQKQRTVLLWTPLAARLYSCTPQAEYTTPLYLFAICLIDGRLCSAYALQKLVSKCFKVPRDISNWRMKIQAVSSTSYHTDWAAKSKMAKDCQLNDSVDCANIHEAAKRKNSTEFKTYQIYTTVGHTKLDPHFAYYLSVTLYAVMFIGYRWCPQIDTGLLTYTSVT